MARRTDVEILANALKKLPGNQASVAKLGAELAWDVAKVKHVVTRAVVIPGMPVYTAKGGVIKYRGSERGASVGLYADVARIIGTYWGPRDLGLRNIATIDTARAGTRGQGVWTHPDLVVAADPRRRESAEEPRRLHAIEIETAAGFDLRSVYQAHAQGRGANYSWVFGSKAPGVDSRDWERVLWTASSLGVGVVTFVKPHAYGTWTTHLEAARRRPTDDEREGFLSQTMSALTREAFEL